MKRVRYLAALGGGAAQRTVPVLQPPRRLFPHEPLLADAPSPPARQPAAPPAAATVMPAPPDPATDGGPAILPAAPIERVSADAGRRPAPAAPIETAALRPPEEAIETRGALPPQQRQVARARLRPVAAAAKPVQTRARQSDSPSPPRAVEPGFEPEPREERMPVARQSRTALEPTRRRPEPPPAAAPRPPVATAGASQVHIGTIEVTVVPPPPPRPSQTQPAAPASPPLPISPRVGSAGRWFGLAQR